ncbi:MAG: hypothetical protein K9J16_11580 [Melioribacteraceae bacterium]|nr:hypothetical protein [Melioribacteraceae bacterium]MCF8354541.1 hypothetical protein [Melioribacteraceae bacterium]MCF8394473.1 hypothetical protein [Melioribacteraceae bacterium]MCF8420117.1 hypothetical protein [Melioribacteraceae bacterium]
MFLFNALLLYKQYYLDKKINTLNKRNNELFLEFHENLAENSILNPTHHKYKFIKMNNDYINNKQFHLFAFLDEKSCIECTQKEIQYLNEFYHLFPSYLTVHYLGEDIEYLKDLGAKFNYIKIQNLSNIFENNFEVAWNVPFVFLVNPENIIFSIHKIETGASIKSKLFYYNMNKLFSTIKK